jgi:hypothetical protein
MSKANKVTSARVASLAGEILSKWRVSAWIKTLAGSVLVQRAPRLTEVQARRRALTLTP